MALVTLKNSSGQTVSVEEGGVIYNSYLSGSHASEGWKVVTSAQEPKETTTTTSTTPTTEYQQKVNNVNAGLDTFLKLLKPGLSQKQVEDLVALYKSNKKMNATDAANLVYAFGENANSAQYYTNQTASFKASELSGDRSRAGKLPSVAPDNYLVYASLEAVPSTTTTPQDTTNTQKATLTSPDGKSKAVVTVGSGKAAQLQGLGWTLGDKGTTTVNATDFLASLSTSEQDAINSLADEITNNPSVISSSSLTPEDLDKYIQEGLTAAKTEMSPYYDEQKKLVLAKYNQGLTDLAAQRDIETQIEKINRDKEKKAIQNDLESRGVTFSGEAVETLGSESALSPELRSQLEGRFQKEQNLIASTSALRFSQNLRDIGQTAETTLGSANVPTAAGYTPTLGVRGSLEREQTTNELNRANELARSKVARAMMTNPDFQVNADFLSYI